MKNYRTIQDSFRLFTKFQDILGHSRTFKDSGHHVFTPFIDTNDTRKIPKFEPQTPSGSRDIGISTFTQIPYYHPKAAILNFC